MLKYRELCNHLLSHVVYILSEHVLRYKSRTIGSYINFGLLLYLLPTRKWHRPWHRCQGLSVQEVCPPPLGVVYAAGEEKYYSAKKRISCMILVLMHCNCYDNHRQQLYNDIMSTLFN